MIREVHRASRGTYGIRRVHAELTLGRGVAVGHRAVELLMRRAAVQGISGRPRFRRVPGLATAGDRVEWRFHRDQPDQLWVTDITEHSTREGKVYCAIVLDRHRRLPGKGPAEIIRRIEQHDHEHMEVLCRAVKILIGTPAGLAMLERCKDAAPDDECRATCREHYQEALSRERPQFGRQQERFGHPS